jgi:homoserine kinase
MRYDEEWLSVFAPATVANVGPGFDVLGLALEQPGDTVHLRRISAPEVHIKAVLGVEGLSCDPRENNAGIAAIETLKMLAAERGVEMIIEKGVPLRSGLGSSAASAVAAAYGVNELFGAPLTMDELIQPALIAEKAVSGYHADNAAPSLMGGVVIIQSYAPLRLRRIESQLEASFVIAHPHLDINTREARAVLPKQIPLCDMVSNCGHLAALIAALYERDVEAFGSAVEDKVVEVARRHLIPGFEDVKKAAMQHGALGCSISGGGPTLFAVARAEAAPQVGKAMQAAFKAHGIECDLILSRISSQGARTIAAPHLPELLKKLENAL